MAPRASLWRHSISTRCSRAALRAETAAAPDQPPPSGSFGSINARSPRTPLPSARSSTATPLRARQQISPGRRPSGRRSEPIETRGRGSVSHRQQGRHPTGGRVPRERICSRSAPPRTSARRSLDRHGLAPSTGTSRNTMNCAPSAPLTSQPTRRTDAAVGPQLLVRSAA